MRQADHADKLDGAVTYKYSTYLDKRFTPVSCTGVRSCGLPYPPGSKMYRTCIESYGDPRGVGVSYK